MYGPTLSATTEWFTSKRGLALGISVNEAAMGGFIFPFFIPLLNRVLGPAWAYCILGFICLFCDEIACIFVKGEFKRLKETKHLSEAIQFDVLRNKGLLISCVTGYYLYINKFNGLIVP